MKIFLCITCTLTAASSMLAQTPPPVYRELVKTVRSEPFARTSTTIYIDSTENIFLQISSPAVRKEVIDEISQQKKLKLTDVQQKTFAGLDQFGCRTVDLAYYLDLTPQKRAALSKNSNFNGVPVSEIKQWIFVSMQSAQRDAKGHFEEDSYRYIDIMAENYKPVVILKAAKNVSYKTIKQVMDIPESGGPGNAAGYFHG